jgi:hypothetical protein
VIVETKLWRNPESRRKVVAQIFDYMKELTKWNFEMLNAAVRNATNRSIQEITEQDDIEFQDYIDNAEKNLKRGKIHLVLIGDGIREETNDLSQILKSSSLYEYTLNLIQMKLFQRDNSDEIIVIPHILATAATIERIQLKVEFGGLQTEPTVEITEIIKEEDAAKTQQKIDEVDFLNQIAPPNREKVEWMLNYFKTNPVVAIRWAGASFLLYVPKENGQVAVNLLRVEKEIIKNRVYYKQVRSLGLIPVYQKEVDQYLEDLQFMGIKIEKGKSSGDPLIAQQSLSKLNMDQVKGITEIIDRAAIRLYEVIGMAEELKTSIDS